jgi:peptide/nickel transport system permease protein
VVLYGVVTLVFIIFGVLPGDPTDICDRCPNDVRESLRKDWGIDKPLSIQYLNYLNDLSMVSIYAHSEENQNKYAYVKLFSIGGNALVFKFPYLRRSYVQHKKVSQIIYEGFAGTFWLTLAAMFFATVVGILFGILAALKRDSFLDRTLIGISVLGISMPSFVVAIFMSLIFGGWLHDFTGLNSIGSLWVLNDQGEFELRLENLILPGLTLGFRPLAIITQLTRNSMITVLSQDYIKTAQAKGANRFQVIFHHALKNAMNPVITAVSGWFASLLAGAFFVEYIFTYKGIGMQTIQAVMAKDFPVIMGVILFIATIFIFINILVDLLYALVDPKVKASAFS